MKSGGGITKIWGQMADWLSSFRRVGGLELPDEGRSSVEGNLDQRLTGALSQFAGLAPEIPFEKLELCKQLRCWNPLFANYVENAIHLGNTGHTVTVSAPNEQRAEIVMGRINETAARLYPHGGGIDGLINKYFDDIATFGALSSEDVIDWPARRIAKVVTVPVEQIRFTWDGQNYLPHQLPRVWTGERNKLGLLPLNPVTYRYYALQTVGNSPYAKPPATAALDDLCGPYTDGKDNLKAVLRKFGLLGFGVLSVGRKAQKQGETEEEYGSRMTQYLARVVKAVEGSFSKGLLGVFHEHKLNFTGVTANAQGVNDIWQIIRGEVFNAFGMSPFMFGDTRSVTETFADVLYSLEDSAATNMRRLPKQRLQDTYKLDLLLGGQTADGLIVQFNRTPSRNALQEAQARETHTRDVLARVRAGVISPDQGAQEMGYDAWFDPELLIEEPAVAAQLRRLNGADAQASQAVTFRFDRSAARYAWVPPQVVLAGAPAEAGNVVSFAKKKTG